MKRREEISVIWLISKENCDCAIDEEMRKECERNGKEIKKKKKEKRKKKERKEKRETRQQKG